MAAVLLLATAAGCSLLGPPPMALLTARTLETAEQRWKTHGADSYHVIVRVRAPKFTPSVYDVVVTDGELSAVVRDGERLGGPDVERHDYSVSGLFEMLRGDLRLTDVPVVADSPAMDLRAHFDDDTGRLVQYRRTVVASGRRRVLLVEVLRYEPLAATASESG